MLQAADLLNVDLIDLNYVHWNWANWGIWLTENLLDPSQAQIVLQTNSYPAQIDAARLGLGVALGWRDLLQEDLEKGHLVVPIDASMASAFGYYVLRRHGSGEHATELMDRLIAPMSDVPE